MSWTTLYVIAAQDEALSSRWRENRASGLTLDCSQSMHRLCVVHWPSIQLHSPREHLYLLVEKSGARSATMSCPFTLGPAAPGAVNAHARRRSWIKSCFVHGMQARQ